jgi:hypothetical protein
MIFCLPDFIQEEEFFLQKDTDYNQKMKTILSGIIYAEEMDVFPL